MMLFTSLFKGKKEEKTDPKEVTANDFINVQDIQEGILYTKDGYVFAYIKIAPIALELLSEEEKSVIIKNLTIELSSERKPFKFFSISRPVNISALIDDLTDAYLVAETPQQKELLKNSINTINGFALSGDVIERQFYFILWEKHYDGCEQDLKKRALDFMTKLTLVQQDICILDSSEIVQLCNLFANPSYSHLEDGNVSPTLPILSVGGDRR